jgi:hypothetical protein
VIELALPRPQTRFDVAQAFAKGQLGESQTKELINLNPAVGRALVLSSPFVWLRSNCSALHLLDDKCHLLKLLRLRAMAAFDAFNCRI